MIGTMLDKVAGQLDRRLVVTLVLPALLFWAGVGSLIATDLGWSRVAEWWSDIDDTRRLALAGTAVASLVFFAYLLAGFLLWIVRWYEGYWGDGPIGRGSTAIGVRLQRWRRRRLDLRDPRHYTRRYQEFPVSLEDLLPTRLGNVLRAAETYAADPQRYGVDSVFFWPRLYAVLSDGLRTALSEARSAMEQMLVISLLSAAFAVISLFSGVWLRLPLAVWLPACAGTVLLSLVTYRAAVHAAIGYGELVRTSFDVHRRTLLSAIGLTPPTTLQEERELWRALGQQLYRRAADRPELLQFGAVPSTTGPESGEAPFPTERGCDAGPQ
jgi:hypothetical protein